MKILQPLPPQRFTIRLGSLPARELNPNSRHHHMVVWSAKTRARDDIMALVFEQGRPPTPFERAHISVTFIAKHKKGDTEKPQRNRDVDNLVAALKPYIDGLVRAGVIVDDSALHVTYSFRYELSDRNDTIIEVMERGS